MFKTLDDIAAHEWDGIHAFDAGAMRGIDRFVMNFDRPISERAAAIRLMITKGMGITDEPDLKLDDEALVVKYIGTR